MNITIADTLVVGEAIGIMFWLAGQMALAFNNHKLAVGFFIASLSVHVVVLVPLCILFWRMFCEA